MNLETKELSILDSDPANSTFVESFVYEAKKNEISLGNLYIVGQIYSTQKKKDNASLLAELAEIIKNEYYRNPNRETISSFKSALKRINNFLEKNKKGLLKKSFKLNLTTAVLTENNLFLAQIGEGVVFVLRKGKLNTVELPNIYENKKDKNKSFLNVVEGALEKEDTLLITTPQIYKVGKENIIRFCQSNILETFARQNKNDFKNLGLVRVLIKLPHPFLSPIKTHSKKKKEKGVLNLISNIKGNEALARAILIVIIIFAVGAITISAAATKKEIELKKREGEKILSQIEALKDRAFSLVQLENYQEAGAAFEEWKENLTTLRVLGVLKDDLVKAEKDLNEAEPIVKKYEKVEVSEILNLSKNTLGFKTEGLTGIKNTIVLFAKNQLYFFDLTTKTGGFTVLPEEKLNIKTTAYNPDEENKIYFLDYENNILAYQQDNLEKIISSDQFKEVKDIIIYNNTLYALTSDKILALDLKKNEAELKSWVGGEVFKKAQDFAIDGFIYVLGQEKIYKLLSGDKNIEIEADDNDRRLATKAGLNNIYLLNPEEGLITIKDKFGNVLKRIQNENLKNAIDLIISGNEKTLFFLKDERVFSIGL